MQEIKNIKPLGKKAYGSIPHLPGSRLGPADHSVSQGQADICLVKPRDRHDKIIIQEKLDGSCCSIAKINNKIYALTRAGYEAKTSPFLQHHYFHEYVEFLNFRFDDILENGERIVGEWLAQAHGTKYESMDDPFVVFDIINEDGRLTYGQQNEKLKNHNVQRPMTLLLRPEKVLPVDYVMNELDETNFSNAIDEIEGAVWRVERKGKVDFLAKYVRHSKRDGIYLPERTGHDPIWHWTPDNLK